MPRLSSLAVAICLLAAACTSSADEPATTTAPAAATTSATTMPPPPTTTTTTEIETSADPQLPDPVETAEQGWGELAGFTSTELNETDLDSVEFRLRPVTGTAIEGVSYTGLQPDGGGAPVIGLSMSPAAFLLGDPFLAPGLAGAIAGPFDDLDELLIDGTTVYRLFLGDRWWYFWASNTHVYATIGSEEPAQDAMAATIAGAPQPYLWQAGDCLWFGVGKETSMPYAPYGSSHQVSCSGPHTHEVIYSSATGYGPADEHPGQDFSTEVERSCGSAFRSYIGVDWPDSKVSAIRYLPDVTEWDEGDRYTACVVELSDPINGATSISGTLEGLGASSLIKRSTGDCYIDTLNADAVDCQLTHRAQFIGFLLDPAPAGTTYPGAADLFGSQISACEALIDEFSPVLEKNGASVSAHVIPPSVVEWEDELRTFRCFAFASDGDGQEIEVSGSFDGNWEIVRFSEDDVTAEVPSSRFYVLANG